MIKFAEIAVDAPAGYDRIFTYSFDTDMAISAGQIVRVPFGPRLVTGVVLSLKDSSDGIETRDVLDAVYSQPVIRDTHLRLARWISEYYRAPLFESVSLMTPPVTRSRSISYLEVNETISRDGLNVYQNDILDYLYAKGRTETTVLLKDLGSKYSVSLRKLVEDSVISLNWEWSQPKTRPRYIEYSIVSADAISSNDIWVYIPKRANRQISALQYLLNANSPIKRSMLVKQFGGSIIRALESRKLISRIRVRFERDPLLGIEVDPDNPPVLTEYQASALLQIEESLEGLKSQVFLVHGVTGSGKTEIYLKALEKAISMGKRAIVMVPEISLTPQTVGRFMSRFPGKVSVLHSGLSDGERYDQWWGIWEGRYNVVIGARSSIFAPLEDLGLIVIDEEHEHAYKQSDIAPRYHSREVALKLASITGATIVMGSATPDIGTYSKAVGGQYRLISIPERVGYQNRHEDLKYNWSLPNVYVADMRDELSKGNRSIFSKMLFDSMYRTLDSGQQVMLYLNRRGSGSLVQCRDCGYVVHCKRCDMAMSYHTYVDKLLCHRCNARSDMPNSCAECGNKRIRYLGLGTQRIVDEVYKEFPGASVLRWDSDVVANDKDHRAMTHKIQSGQAQVVVGTQMIAKGLDFPNIGLVGVILADIGLFLPDFKASERVFQLLCQVAGRAGRGATVGDVVIQTYNPEHYVIQAAANQDYYQFYKKEMAYRIQHKLPPSEKLVRLVISHNNDSACEARANLLAVRIDKRIAEKGISGIDVIGPSPAHPHRLRGRYRWHILIRGRYSRDVVEEINIPKDCVVDVEPISLL